MYKVTIYILCQSIQIAERWLRCDKSFQTQLNELKRTFYVAYLTAKKTVVCIPYFTLLLATVRRNEFTTQFMILIYFRMRQNSNKRALDLAGRKIIPFWPASHGNKDYTLLQLQSFTENKANSYCNKQKFCFLEETKNHDHWEVQKKTGKFRMRLQIKSLCSLYRKNLTSTIVCFHIFSKLWLTSLDSPETAPSL